MAKQFRRSEHDRKISGVCGGIAEYFGLDSGLVRIAAVLLAVFTQAPIVIAYLLIAMFVPRGESGDPELDVAWQTDGTSVSWQGATVPYAWSWWAVIGLLVGASALAVVGAAGGGVGAVWLGADIEWTTPLLVLPAVVWPGVLFGMLFAVLPRSYALTLTHAALWVERPLRGTERVDPGDIQSIHRDRRGLRLMLDSGECLRFPPVSEDAAMDEFLADLRAGRERMLAHRADLESAQRERAVLLQMVGRSQAPRGDGR